MRRGFTIKLVIAGLLAGSAMLGPAATPKSEEALASFENEWKRLREHPEWPDTSKLRQSSPKDDAPSREETRNS